MTGLWCRLPTLLRAAIWGLAAFAVVFTCLLVWNADHLSVDDVGNRLIGLAGLAALPGLVTAAWYQRVAGRFGSFDRRATYRQALRSGVLPSDAEAEAGVWWGWLSHSRIQTIPAHFVSTVLLVLVVAPSLIYRPTYHTAAVVLVGLLALWGVAASWRTQSRIFRLRAELLRRTDAAIPATLEESVAEDMFRSSAVHRMIHLAFIGFCMCFAVAFVDRQYHGGDLTMAWLLAWAAIAGGSRAAVTSVGGDRRDFASLNQAATYVAALRTGELPADADPVVWRARLAHSRRSNRVAPVWFGVMVGLAVAPSVAAGSVYWITALTFGLIAWGQLMASLRSRREIARLATEVEQRSAGTGMNPLSTL